MHLGAAALQVLIAARLSWQADGRALALRAPSEGLAAGLERLGASVETITVEAPRQTLTVLAVDDSRTMRDLLGQAL